MMGKIGKRYLIILIIINVVFILFDLGIIIYANIELSNNIDDFIHVHLNMKNSIIMLLFVKSKFIVNNNKKEKNKYFNAWSKVESKKRNNQMDGIELDKLNLLMLESKDKDVGNITGVDNVTINISISSEKNIITISTEEKQENNYENNYDNRLELKSKLKNELKDINNNDLEQIKGVSYDPEVSALGKETVLYNKKLVSDINSKLRMHRESAVVDVKINKGSNMVPADSSSKSQKSLFLFLNKLPN